MRQKHDNECAKHGAAVDGAARTVQSSRRDVTGWAAVAVAGALVVSLSWFRIGNLDLGYHISYGRHFLDMGEIVGFKPDPRLYPETGISFVNANWGSQVVFALVERVGGSGGLFALRLGLIAAIFAAVGHVAYRRTGQPLAAAIAWLLAAMAGYERFSLRPELFSYAILAIQLVVLTGGVRMRRHIIALVGLQLLLVNLHSYFLLGAALTLCWVVENCVAFLRASDTERPARRTLFQRIAIVFVLQIAACFCHPWHVRAAVFPLKTLAYLSESSAMGGGSATGDAGSWSHISEFQSPFSFIGEPINQFTIHAYLVLSSAVLVGLIVALIRRQWARALAMAGFFLVATQMRRNIAPFAFIAAPLAVAAVTNAILARGRSLQRLRNIASIVTIVATAGLIFFVTSGRMYYAERRITRQFGTGYSETTFPHAAVAWLAGQPSIEPRLFVDYFASSNALLGLPERFTLPVDTNTFAYSEATLDEVFKLGLGEIPHDEYFDKYGINVVLLHCGPDTQALIRNLVQDDLDWATVYADSTAVIFLRRGVWAHVDIILANSVAPTIAAVRNWPSSVSGTRFDRSLRLCTMANVPLAMGWWDAAADVLREVVELTPDYAEAWLLLGTCYANMGNAENREFGDLNAAASAWRQAIRCFERAAALNDRGGQAAAMLQRTRERLMSAEAFLRGPGPSS